VLGRVSTTAQARHDARAGLAHALLNESCIGSAYQTRLIWPSIPPHDNDGPRLSCCHLVCHPASFLSPLTQYRFHRRWTSRSSSRPSPSSFSSTYYPRPWSQPRADRRSSMRVRGESVLLLAFLRACRRGGHGGICHA
jgi:hypothetical protein